MKPPAGFTARRWRLSPRRAGIIGKLSLQVSAGAAWPPALLCWWGRGRKGSTGTWAHTRRAQSQCQQLLALVRDKEELKCRILPSAPSSVQGTVLQFGRHSEIPPVRALSPSGAPRLLSSHLLTSSLSHLASIYPPRPSPSLRPRGGEQISVT